MKMNGNEKTELKLLEKCTLSDNRNTYDPFGGLFLRCWSLPQAFCLLSAGLCFWLWLLLSANLCFWLRLDPRAFIIIGVPNYRFSLGPGSPPGRENAVTKIVVKEYICILLVSIDVMIEP